MDTNRIKKFATEARNILKKGIAVKITSLGFDAKGQVPESHKPQLMQGGSLWNGQLQTEGFYHRWMALYRRVEQKGIKEVYEEAAYTWFNRLMAIRILQKNGLCEGVLDYADAAHTPRIVNEARTGNILQMSEENRRHLMDLLDDDTKVTEQFALLITAWCQQNPILAACFGGMADYTELLLPTNILVEGGFVDMINHTEFITDEEYRSPELIGWLYQFYISERKDEVFAKKGKFEADEIAPATQIFTPNWIVKYMVQNTVGRIYLDNNPWTADELKPKWQYLVTPSEPTPQESIYRYDELTDLKVADLACGSGHILNECFDLLYDLYIAEGYSRREAIENIFTKNLTGVDLDTRAKQLATFALLLKASQRDASFADAHVMPHVIDMPRCDRYTWRELSGHFNCRYGLHCPEASAKELDAAFMLMEDADSLGSIMKFDVSDTTKLYIHQCIEQYEADALADKGFRPLIKGMKVIETLTTTYSALVMNPPYMNCSKSTKQLADYTKLYYPNSKEDLFAVFMELSISLLHDNGKYGMLNMQAWMYLSSYKNLRKIIFESQHIESMLHLGPRTFDELGGEVVQNTAFVISKNNYSRESAFFKLITGKSCSEKEQIFLSDKSIRYNIKNSKRFLEIENCPIAYSLSEEMFNIQTHFNKIANDAVSFQGIITGNNDLYLRQWFEINNLKFGSTFGDFESDDFSKKYWVPYNKGGRRRRWYGNQDLVVDFRLKASNFTRGKLQFSKYYFKEYFSWDYLGGNNITARYFPKGFLWDVHGSGIFTSHKKLLCLLGFLNTKVGKEVLTALNPTLSFQVENILATPSYAGMYKDCVENIVDKAIFISKDDWDVHETSWDFQENELIRMKRHCGANCADLDMLDEEDAKEILATHHIPTDGDSLEDCYKAYVAEWTRKFHQLHANEEELNRQFIDIYGLQDELTPDVPLDEVTILQQGEISVENGSIVWHPDVVIKQLISYAIGCWMGRYRLDKPGLHIAHPEPTADEVAPYEYHGNTFDIDDDGIIPILPQGCPFEDNMPTRIANFIRIAFGEEHLTENLNYMEKQLGMSIEQYVLKDFWKDHKKMYQNRPIYWLFSSKKGAFKCITYMHRMDAYTAECVRSKYLLPYIEMLSTKVADLTNRAAQLSTAERRQLDNLKKTLEECNEYHDRLQQLAEDTERTTFDLDDGVVVNYAKYGDVLAKIK